MKRILEGVSSEREKRRKVLQEAETKRKAASEAKEQEKRRKVNKETEKRKIEVAEEEEDPVGAEQETESGAAAWTPDPACILVNDPYTQAGYYGYIVDIDQFTDAKEISNGIRELANLLAMIDMHPSIPAEAKDILKTCEPRLKTVLVRFRLSFF